MSKLIVVIITLVLFSSAHAERLLDPMPQTMVAQNFTLPNINGEDVSLDDYKGSFVLVNFWALSCVICRAELTVIQDLHDQLSKDYKFEVVAIHAGPKTPELDEVLALNPVNYSIVTDAALQLGHWGIPNLPTSYIITPEGNFAYRALGTKVWNAPYMVDFLRNFMDSHLEGATSSPISSSQAN